MINVDLLYEEAEPVTVELLIDEAERHGSTLVWRRMLSRDELAMIERYLHSPLGERVEVLQQAMGRSDRAAGR